MPRITPMTGPDPSAARRSRNVPSRARAGTLLALLASLAVAIAACGGGAVLSTVGSSVGGEAGLAPVPAATAAPAARSASGAEVNGQRDLAAETVTGPLIVRTGQLTLEIGALDDALAAAARAVTAAGGYVAASQRQGDGDTASATVTYRIPAARWEETLAALRAVGTKVLSEQTASEEVTSQVVDLAARLVNLRATEAALQSIMTKATKIPDILEVQAQLTSVRQEIEQLTAQKQTLEKQAALATLTVDFTPKPVIAVTQVQQGWDPANEVDRAAATLVGIGQAAANAAIWAAIVLLPLALILGLAVGIAWLVARRFRARPAPPAPPATLDAAAEGPAA
jgi:Domain of unknown function (DUF4349)